MQGRVVLGARNPSKGGRDLSSGPFWWPESERVLASLQGSGRVLRQHEFSHSYLEM